MIESGIFDAHVRPACRVFHNAAQSIPNATDTVLAFNSERFDNGAMHDTVVNNSRITIVTPGVYTVSCNVEWPANATGFRRCQLRVNGATLIASITQPVSTAAVVTAMRMAAPWQFAAADYVEVLVHQTSTAALNVNSTASYSPEFGATLETYL